MTFAFKVVKNCFLSSRNVFQWQVRSPRFTSFSRGSHGIIEDQVGRDPEDQMIRKVQPFSHLSAFSTARQPSSTTILSTVSVCHILHLATWAHFSIWLTSLLFGKPFFLEYQSEVAVHSWQFSSTFRHM